MVANLKKICLAIETAVASGSVAILDSGELIAESGSEEFRASRAEEVLGAIQGVCDSAGVTLDRLSTLVVSTGPGSYSGIRIGIATALGLKDALGISCRGISVLESIAFILSAESDKTVVAAVPVGKSDVAFQRFDRSNGILQRASEPALVTIDLFRTSLSDLVDTAVYAPRDLLERMGDDLSQNKLFPADAGATLAATLGKYAHSNATKGDLRPIYIRSGIGF